MGDAKFVIFCERCAAETLHNWGECVDCNHINDDIEDMDCEFCEAATPHAERVCCLCLSVKW